MFCTNCGKEFEGKFCPECGTPTTSNVEHVYPMQEREQFSGPDIVDPPKTKKKAPKGCLIAVLVFLGIVVLIGVLGGGNDAKSTLTQGSVSSSVPIQPISASSNVSSDTNSNHQYTSEDMQSFIDLLSSEIAPNYDGEGSECKFVFDEETQSVMMNISGDGVTRDVMNIVNGNADIADWDTFKQNHITLCNSFVELAKTMDYGDIHCVVNVLNDVNKDNILLMIMDGVVVYDVVNE